MIQNKPIPSIPSYVPLMEYHTGNDLQLSIRELPVEERNLAIPHKNAVINQYIEHLYVQYNKNGWTKTHSVFLPMITKGGLGDILGKRAPWGSGWYFVKHPSIPERSRVLQICDFFSGFMGDTLQAQKIASDCGVSPHFYGAALVQIIDERYTPMKRYWVFLEFDFIENTGDRGPDYNKKVLEKVHTLYERGVLQSDLRKENILIDKEDRMFIIDYGLARAFSNTDECMKLALPNRIEAEFLQTVVIEVLESQLKKDIDVNRKELVERFFGWASLKKQLIGWFSKFSTCNLNELKNMKEFELADLKKKCSLEEEKTLIYFFNQWLTTEKTNKQALKLLEEGSKSDF